MGLIVRLRRGDHHCEVYALEPVPYAERKGLATLCVQSAQSRTRSSEIAFLRTVLVWLSKCIPYQLNNFQTTQKRNLGRTRPRLRTLYA